MRIRNLGGGACTEARSWGACLVSARQADCGSKEDGHMGGLVGVNAGSRSGSVPAEGRDRRAAEGSSKPGSRGRARGGRRGYAPVKP